MIKNTSGQKIGAQMVSASDGSAFTGTVTVYVTGDAGTQALGSVGAGVCTHEGNGYHTYAPAQAETNYDVIAFTFIGSGAIPQTVQVFTIAGDAFTRLGAPAGASIAADLLVIDNFVDDLETRLTSTRAGYLDNLSAGAVALQATAAAIEVDTQDLQARLPAALVSGRIDASVGAMAANVLTAAALATDAVNEIADQVWDESAAAHIAAGSTGESLAEVVTDADTAVQRLPTTLVGGRIDASVGAMAANVLTASALAADAVDEILDDPIGDGSLTLRQALRVLVAGMAGKLSGAATTTITIRNAADSANVIVATVDADGNRTAVTVTP